MRCFRKFAKISPVSGRFLFVFSALLLFASVAFGAGDYQRTKDGKTTVWNAEPKPGDEATWWWLLGYFVVLTIGELYLSPISLSLVSKAAPARMVSMTMGLWRDLVNFVGICGSARPIPW